MIHIKSKRDNLIVKSTTFITLATILMMIVVATAGIEIIGINRSADAFVIPGLGKKQIQRHQ